MSVNGVTLYYYVNYPIVTDVAEYTSIDNVTLTETGNYRLEVTDGGLASNVSIYEEGVMSVKGTGRASNITIYATTKSANIDGYLHVGEGGTAEAINVYGDAEIDSLGVMSDVSVYSGGVVQLFTEGILENATIEDGGRVYSYSSYLDTLTLNNGAKVCVYGGSIENATLKNGGTLLANNSAFLQNITLKSGASLTLSSASIIAGTFKFEAGAQISADQGTEILFTLDTPGTDAFIEDFTNVSGTPYYVASVSEKQTTGTYTLAGNALTFASHLYFYTGNYAAMTMSVGSVGVYHNSVYALALTDGTLSVNVIDYQTSATADALSWADINGASSYALEMAQNGGTTLSLEVATRGVELLGLANGNYTWQVRNSAESDNWQTGKAFEQTEALEGPRELTAMGEASTALFFAKANGVWDSNYVAKNTMTGETAKLAGKIKITDIFTGSDNASIDNASILMLDAFCENTVAKTRSVELAMPGMVLFLDDIYSAAPGSAERARLSNIDTIIATDGDDIIDLTSDRYDLAGNVTLLGGKGDDILWANSGNDVLSGGAGNDTLHGGGGNDIFCFGEGWGEDTIGQLAGGKVVLWFAKGDESKWDAATLTYADGANKVIVSGVDASAIELRFGATGYENEYTTLAAAGVFA